MGKNMVPLGEGSRGSLCSPVGQEQWRPLKCFKQESDIQVYIYKIH